MAGLISEVLKYWIRKAWGLKIVKERDQTLGAHGVLELEPQDRRAIFIDFPFLKFFIQAGRKPQDYLFMSKY